MKSNATLATGFVGLGAMGAPMAHNLYQAGYLVAAWNRSRQRLDAFLEDHPRAAAGLLDRMPAMAPAA